MSSPEVDFTTAVIGVLEGLQPGRVLNFFNCQTGRCAIQRLFINLP